MVLEFGIQNNLVQNFVQEASGLLQLINEGLLELSDNYSAPKIRNLVRAAQLIKTTAAQVNFTDIHTLAHRLEKIFRFLSLGNAAIDSQLTTLLLQANDCLRLLLITQIQGKFDDVASIIAKAETIFAYLESRISHKLEIVPDVLETTYLGASVPQLMPTTEIAQALKNLEKILAESDADKLPEQLIKQANLFLGFGEFHKISEFIAIAQIAIATLQTTPQASETIGKLALVGWRAAYEAILNKNAPQTDQGTSNSSAVVLQNRQNPALTHTIKTTNLFVWVAGGNVFTVKSDSVEELLVAEADQIIYSQQQRFLHWREQIIPSYQLSELLSYGSSKPLGNRQPEPILVLNLGQQILALEPEIQYLIAEPELVINPLPTDQEFSSCVYGCTIWKDHLLPVIDVAALLQQTINHSQQIYSNTKLLNPADTAIISREPTILVVDDSHSVRHIVSLTLQREGYQVLQAEDGQEAIAQLQQNPHVQMVICDIEMPNLNGFEFLSYRLKDSQLAKIPVIMLSSCSTNQHRQLAMQLGATTYFTKPYVEEDFLTALRMSVN
ncbi:response regulator [Tolypothrix sp. PCC 7910]|uniref:response regulator n=1 Tax=Tolypothrix sp. PCC 7910 TaxID=2099387 RepID=UPI00142794FD|nr:response regulator [Tolypothrix sp. PCC 7910]QIR36907.1 response regulator [Tolypothrix sp. PCC 7910]